MNDIDNECPVRELIPAQYKCNKCGVKYDERDDDDMGCCESCEKKVEEAFAARMAKEEAQAHRQRIVETARLIVVERGTISSYPEYSRSDIQGALRLAEQFESVAREYLKGEK